MIRYYFYTMLRQLIFASLIIGLLAALVVSVIVGYFIPKLPSIDDIKQINAYVPLRVYSYDGKFMAEFGTQRSIPTEVHRIPQLMVDAMLATEDSDFFEHGGVSLKSLTRAAVHIIKTGRIEQGGSTITMQVAKNLFLSPERTFERKFSEILLAMRMEQALTKAEILELYFNKIYFGNRAYGIQAAAFTYYSRPLSELTVAEYAMLAGIPKFPSSSNPIANPSRAMERRNYILQRMLDLNYIDADTYAEAVAQPNTAKLYRAEVELSAPYMAEMARQYMEQLYGEDAYTRGFKVYTTIKSQLQDAAQSALRRSLISYDERHGYRGVVGKLELPSDEAEAIKLAQQNLPNYPGYGGLQSSVVLAINNKSITAYNSHDGNFTIEWKGLAWARKYISDNRRANAPQNANSILKVGDIIMARKVSGEWRLAQIPRVEGALVSLDPHSGAILAVAGGFDFYQSNFNRVTQALRQPGSSFKPFIYSAALDHGFTPASMINDAPVTFKAGNKLWTPKNFTDRFYGPTSMRTALTYSRNLVSIRLLNSMGVESAIDHVVKFGFDRDRIPKNLTISLGTGEVTPLELTRGYAVFANGGYLITPYFVDRVEISTNQVVHRPQIRKVCTKCDEYRVANATELELITTHSHAPRVIDARNAWITTSMMQDVIKRGTAVQAQNLKDNQLAGKTGTTNDHRDAWFAGFNSSIVTTAWIGFDHPRSLGNRETGARAALPMWIDYMRVALKTHKSTPMKMPPGVVARNIDPGSGHLAASGGNSRQEFFYQENVPRRRAVVAQPSSTGGRKDHSLTMGEPLF
jgi:penicillin-binding protein 1A